MLSSSAQTQILVLALLAIICDRLLLTSSVPNKIFFPLQQLLMTARGENVLQDMKLKHV